MSGERGPATAAFFDVDGTLLAGFSIFAFWRDRFQSGELSFRDLRQTMAAVVGYQRQRIGFSGLMTALAQSLRDVEEKSFAELGDRLFDEELATLLYPESRALVEAHHEMGHTLVIVSSATRYQVEPLARDLGIPHVLCSELEVEDGRFTGRSAKTCFGTEKADAARALADAHGVDLQKSYFYTDGHEDLPLLRTVGRPRPINPDRNLDRHASRKGWTIRKFGSRGLPASADVGRTVLALSSMSLAPWLALPGALLNGDPRGWLNTAMSVGCDLGATIAGVQLVVEGEENLWKQRPAVFIFNHQSAIDAILVGKMVRRDIVGVAKRELRPPGLFGAFAEATGTAFVDRKNTPLAIEALKPVVSRVQKGMSVVIAPEGTRSPTLRLGPFKKGAFQIALQAGVPVVPIIFRNALDALPKHAWIVRPARVDAVVLPPISTEGWTVEGLPTEIARIRSLYLQALHQDRFGHPKTPNGIGRSASGEHS